MDIAALAQIVANHKAQGTTVVQCHGVFDLVHPGHIQHLEAASREGDILIVTVTADRFVNKGPGRPVFNSRLRAETLAALSCVQYVAVNDAKSAIPAIELIRPDVFIKGNDYANSADDVTGMIDEEIRSVEAVGGRVHFTDEMTLSSSELLNSHFDVYRSETREWLNQIKRRYPTEEITGHLDQIRGSRVLVIGEAIIDEYFFCEGLGKSSKDPILAFKSLATEKYVGGSLAVANHLAGICDTVGLVTILGEESGNSDYVNDRLQSNVKLMSISRIGAPTIHKRRYVDDHTGAKLFELYTLDDSPIEGVTERALLERIGDVVKDYDVVVVADYGHGMMVPSLVSAVTEQSKFLAVNTQSNAGNRGFNIISKYPRADYVCLNGGELELEVRMKDASFKDLIKVAAERIDCDKFTITLGRNGSMHYQKGHGFIEAPALAVSVGDRVGAGDAVLSITAPLVAKEVPWDLVGLYSNLAGAELVAEIGNRVSIDRRMLVRHINSMLK